MWWDNKRIEELSRGRKRRYKNGILRGVCLKNLRTSKVAIILNTKLLRYNHPTFEEFDVLFHELLHVINFLDIRKINYLIDDIYAIYDKMRWKKWKQKTK
jgi:hypothetical protein